MYPAVHAAERPDHPAVIMPATGEVVTYAALEAGSNRLARLLRAHGLGVGGRLAVLMETNRWFHEVCWAAQRSGLYYTPVNWLMPDDDVAFTIRDCGAQALVVSARFAERAAALVERTPEVELRLAVGGDIAGHARYEEAIAPFDPTPLPDETEGSDVVYSGGTTGRPKGVELPLSGRHPAEAHPMREALSDASGFDGDTMCLTTAPLHHSAALGWSMRVHRRGGTVIPMERFDPGQALALIERYRITHSHWVPTMFVRLLRLPPETRERYDLSSHRRATHSAGPCPVGVKQRLIEWWGPIVDEIYGGTERNGLTFITAEEWLRRPGSVGRPVFGEVRILGPDGEQVPPGEVGTIYFSAGGTFAYRNDPGATAAARGPDGSTTLGDLGCLDEDGYLYVTGRRDLLIVTGGINVNPRDVEEVLLAEGDVADAVVVGVDDEEYGQRVTAVVAAGSEVDPPAFASLIARRCRARLAGFQCPRTVVMVPSLPREPNGKLRRSVVEQFVRAALEGRAGPGVSVHGQPFAAEVSVEQGETR